MSGRLAGRVALVTGASRGIGAEVARAYAAEGASVVVNHLPDERMAVLAEEVVAAIRAGGGAAIAVGGDVSVAADVDALVTRARAEYGYVDVLVANAAINPRTGWDDLTEDEWDRVLASNLKGAFLPARAVYPDMRERGYGKIVTVSSITVELGSPWLPYVVSKAGLVGFTRSLARQVGVHGIRVNSVMPGAIRTEAERETFPDEEQVLADLRERQCLPYLGTAPDLAGVFVYLASHDSDFVTGQVITVDGGWVHY